MYFTEVKMEQLFENKDIMRLIYSFGYAEHRHYMKEMSKSIRVCGNYDPIGWPENRVNDEALPTFLKRKSRTELIDLYNRYNKCRCCTRHSYFKPKLFEMRLNPKITPNPYYKTDETTECACVCRHRARLVFIVYWL